MKLLKIPSLIFLFALCALAFISCGEVQSTEAKLAVHLSADETVETEKIPIYGKPVEVFDISDTESTASVKATVYESPVNEGEHTVVISGTGKMKNWAANTELPWYKSYSKTLTRVIIEDGVKNVGYYAFSLCEALREVTLAESVRNIGVMSFYHCTSLEKINFPTGMSYIAYYAFACCPSLEISDLNGVKRIYDGAFEGCASVKSVTIPKVTTDIGLRTFAGCTSLTEILVEEGSEVYSSFEGNLYTKDGKALVVYAPGKTATSFTVPDSVTALADYSMESCTLESLTVGGAIESVGAYALRGSLSLSSVSFGEGVKSLGAWALAECPSLVSVDLGGVETVGAYAFCYDTALREITLTPSVSTLGASAFYSCTALERADLGSLVTLGEFAFARCTSLVSVDFGTALTALGASAFRNCIALEGADLPQSVESVGAYAFGGCTSLCELTLRSDAPLSDGSCGAALSYAKNIFLLTPTLPDSVASAFPGASAVLRSGEIYYLFSSCIHLWNKAEEGYSCTECAARRDAHDITSVGVTVGYDLSVSVYADAPEGASVLFTMNGKTTEALGTFDSSLGLWRFTFHGVAPQYMGELITAELSFGGVTLSTLSEYSVRRYCDDLLSMSAAELGMSTEKHAALHTLVYDLLDYGSAAQLYVGYKTDALVNGGTEGGRVFESIENSDFTLENINLTDGVYFTAASLWFDSTNRLSFKLTAPDPSRITLRLTVGGTAREYTAEDLTKDGALLVLTTDSINATAFDNLYTVTLIYDGIEVQRLTYSVLAYLAEKQSSTDPLTAVLVGATASYGASADAYAAI